MNNLTASDYQRLKDRVEKLESLAEWCRPDEHSPIGHWEAFRACFPASGEAKS